MLDDEIERRVRLIRLMEQHHASLTMMAESHWVEADRAAFASAWTAEVADVPAFSDSTIHRLGPVAADLEAPAERVDAGLPAPDRRRRSVIIGRWVRPPGSRAHWTGTGTLASG